ncbi:MAG: protein phosphatase 2C domain-containing protein [Streptosporangiales bacterium]|nr:protein phosphatase 2C domain-containing protein [Streptosporangiales bacterium]
MRVATASEPAPGRANEDLVRTGRNWAAVFDGATRRLGEDGGCVHDVPWLVRTLGAALAELLDDPRAGSAVPLPDALAAAIEATMAAHSGTCDLDDPGSPSSTVAILRERDGLADHLVLCDSPIVLCHRDGHVEVVQDERLDRLPGGRPYSAELVRALRNTDGGFWVASTRPEAAYRAVTGTAPVASLRGAALLTDGVSRLVEAYGTGWPALADRLARYGPQALIRQVRETERRLGPRGAVKPHDDATVAWITWDDEPAERRG